MRISAYNISNPISSGRSDFPLFLAVMIYLAFQIAIPGRWVGYGGQGAAGGYCEEFTWVCRMFRTVQCKETDVAEMSWKVRAFMSKLDYLFNEGGCVKTMGCALNIVPRSSSVVWSADRSDPA